MTQMKIMTQKGKMLTFYYISVLTTNFQTKPFQKPQHSHSPKAVKILWKNIHMGKFYSRNSFLAIFAMFTFVSDIYEHVRGQAFLKNFFWGGTWPTGGSPPPRPPL